jgi:hypothetical protein
MAAFGHLSFVKISTPFDTRRAVRRDLQIELEKHASEHDSIHWSSNNNVCDTAHLPPALNPAELLAERSYYLEDSRK